MRGAGGARRPPRFVEETLNILVEETPLKIVEETLLNIFVEETPLKIATSRLNRLSSKACLSPAPCLISRILKHSKIRISLEFYSSRAIIVYSSIV